MKYRSMGVLTIVLCLLASCLSADMLSACMAPGSHKPLAPYASADASILLGGKTMAANLYSYPNSCNAVVCFQDELLDETILRWFDCSVQRDGFDARTRVRIDDGNYYIDIALEAESSAKNIDAFVKRYEEFLGHGKNGIELARAYNKQGKWLSNWRFILPHGLAMTNNRSLEVMNFPPVSLVLKTQDYLNSNTTHRWNKMLAANGVQEEHFALYGAILDIVPVGAPANEGSVLTQNGIYKGAFNGYAKPMLQMWTKNQGASQHAKPVMTLGSAMSNWFNDTFGTQFENLLDVELVSVTANATKVPVMYTHHPSAIFYSDSYKRAKAFMDQDTIASCWQAELGKRPESDPFKMKETCTTRWAGTDQHKCELIWTQVCDKTDNQAESICAGDQYQSLRSNDDNEWCKQL